MGLMPEGIKLFVVGLTGMSVSFLSMSHSKIAGAGLFLLFLIFTLFSLYFFRDPRRDRHFAENEIASPADGRVISIKEEGDHLVLRIFLSIFDVHIQRAPLSGQIGRVNFIHGKFMVAYDPMAKENQRNSIEIKTSSGKNIVVEQITGAIARRIACYVKEGDNVSKSQKIGMIYFGSQVALFLPKDAKISVKEGDRVFAGETSLGTI